MIESFEAAEITRGSLKLRGAVRGAECGPWALTYMGPDLNNTHRSYKAAEN